jgi:hypothetical protein
MRALTSGADLDLGLGLDLSRAVDGLHDLLAAHLRRLDLGVLAPAGAGDHDAPAGEDEDEDTADPEETPFDFHAGSTSKGQGGRASTGPYGARAIRFLAPAEASTAEASISG